VREPLVSIILPVLDNCRFTAQCLASLARNADGIPYEIIVVDNGSTDDTLSFVGSHTPGQLRGKAQGETPPVAVTLLHNPDKASLSKSWNMGCEAARGKYLLVSNNDVIYAPHALKRLVDTLETSPQFGIAIPLSPQDVSGMMPEIAFPETIAQTVANIESVEAWVNRHDHLTDEFWMAREPYIPQGGYCFLMTRECWSEMGHFDEDFKLTGEDYEYFHRLKRRFKMVQARGAYVEHYGKVTCMWMYDEYHERLCYNRFLLAEKCEGLYQMFNIIMPVYNRVDALREAINSVLWQTFPHWRLYVIDDGSEEWDRIAEVAEEFKKHANRIWFFHKPKREGPGAARNHGLRLAKRGKYIAFLDSDDIWFPDHLSKHWESHESGTWEAVYSDPQFAWRWRDKASHQFLYKPDTHPTIHYWGEFDRALLEQFNFIQTSGISVWGPTARSIKFTDRMIEEDWDYCKQIPNPILHLPKETLRYHIAKNPESENLVTRVVRLSGATTGWETRQSIIIPHKLEEKAPLAVIIPTKNRPEELSQALESVLYDDIPVCVVDDGSEDASAVGHVVCQRQMNSLLRAETSHGPSWARNRGSEYLPCEWIQFLDDDDIFIPSWWQGLSIHLSNDWDVVIAPAWVMDCNAKGLTVCDDLYTSQLCVRRDVLLRAGGFTEAIGWAEERDLVERLANQGARIKRVKTPFVMRLRRGNNKMTSAGEKGSERRRRGMF
jgi:glycosyltransferase involved in cell wall biosynthesis